MEKKDLRGNNLEEILYDCAILRNVAMLPHRIVKEFSWFIEECRHGQLREEYKEKISSFNRRENPLRMWGLLFYDYCFEEYGDT